MIRVRPQLVHHPQAEREAKVEPDGVADDLSREAVAAMRAGWPLHPTSFAGFGVQGQTELP